MLGDLSGKLVGMILMSPGPRCTNPLSEGFLRQLEAGPGPDYEFLPPDSAFPRARSALGLGEGGSSATRGRTIFLCYAALTRRTPPGRLTQCGWEKSYSGRSTS